MKEDLIQTRLIGLTLELEIRVKEYKDLCDELDKIKEVGTSPNDPRLLLLKAKLLSNQQDISNISKHLRDLNNNE